MNEDTTGGAQGQRENDTFVREEGTFEYDGEGKGGGEGLKDAVKWFEDNEEDHEEGGGFTEGEGEEGCEEARGGEEKGRREVGGSAVSPSKKGAKAGVGIGGDCKNGNNAAKEEDGKSPRKEGEGNWLKKVRQRAD